MPRRGSTNQWNTRLSAGGANKTNIHGQMNRVSDPDVYAPHRPSSSDLLPAPRQSSFQPWNSRVFAQQHSPQPPQRYWEPQHRHVVDNLEPPLREYSSDILLDEKGRPVPRRGMFLNAKRSEAVRPTPNEQQIQRTEEIIQRIVNPRGRSRPPSYMPDYGLRNTIRQVVYDMGVPTDYRAPPTQYSSRGFDLNRANYNTFVPASHNQSHRHSATDHNGPSTSRRPREESSEEEEEVEEVTQSRKTGGRKSSNLDSEPTRTASSRGEKHIEKRKRHVEPEKDTSDKESPVLRRSSLNRSQRSVTKNNDDHNTSRASRTSADCTPKQLTPSPQYVRDPDEDDNWKNALSFMCKQNDAGSSMFSRIGSAIPSIPLKDNTQNSYSKVALMLLGRSIENSKLEVKPVENKETIQTQMMNMSTSWVRTMNGLEEKEEDHRDAGNTLMNEISKIQNPQNATKVQMSESLFKNSNLIEATGVSELRESMRERKKPRMIPPPRFQSSPISNDVFRSEEGITMPSSIRKTQNGSDDEEDPSTKVHDLDDYIARGASQINFSRTLESLSTSFKKPHPIELSSGCQEMSNPKRTPSSSSELVGETPRQSSCQRRQKDPIPNCPTEKSTLQMDSQFMFSTKKTKKTGSKPMLDFDAETQKMFDDVFSNEKVGGDYEEAARKKNKEKYSF